MRQFKGLFWLIIVIGFFLSCQKSLRNSSTDFSGNVHSIGKDSFYVEDILHRFPSPLEMLMIVERIKPVFKEGILNKVENHKSYFDSWSQALNIGVYSADLAYLSFNNKFKESVSYFNVIYSLSDKLEISSVFSEEVIKRFQNNITNVDSLQLLMETSVNNLSEYLSANKNERFFSVISIGGFIETMYISFHIVDGFTDNNPLIQRIADQKYVLDNIISYSRQYRHDPMVKSSIELLMPIKEIYDQLEVTNSETVVEKQPDGKMLIKGGNTITITNEQYKKLKDIVFKIRNQIVLH